MTAVPQPIEVFEISEPSTTGSEVIEATWAEMGQKLRAVGTRVFVRTEKPPEKKGLIWLPPEYGDTFGRRLGGQVPVTGTVLSVGHRVPQGILEEGERVFFFRLPFGWTHKMTDGTFVGWIDYTEIIGRPVGEGSAPYHEAQ